MIGFRDQSNEGDVSDANYSRAPTRPQCSGAHYWARRCLAYDLEPKLMAAQFVKPFRESCTTKNDRNDAEAIAPRRARQQAFRRAMNVTTRMWGPDTRGAAAKSCTRCHLLIEEPNPGFTRHPFHFQRQSEAVVQRSDRPGESLTNNTVTTNMSRLIPVHGRDR